MQLQMFFVLHLCTQWKHDLTYMNVHQTFVWRPGRNINIFCTLHLGGMSTDFINPLASRLP